MESDPYYWTNPLKDEFEVTIDSIIKMNDHYYVGLIESIVKPTGGGQAGDRGVIRIAGEEYSFIDTILHDEKVVIVVEKPIHEKGTAELRIDMDWRRKMMANHTSEHIFVGALKKKHPELKLGRIWVDGVHGTVILEGVDLSIEEILETESEITEIIDSNVPVTSEIVRAGEVDKSVRAREGVTSKHERIRLVRVGEFDASACSGVHVTNTQEIGVFKIVDIKFQEKETYIEFISGIKAIEALTDVYNEVLVRKYEYPFEIGQLGAILDKAKTIQDAYDQLIEKVLQLMKNGNNIEKIGDVEFWFEYLPGLDSSAIKHLLKELRLEEPSITLFFAPGKKTNLTVWTNGMPQDAAYYISDTMKKLGGRGGGSADVYTGGFSAVDHPEDLFNSIVESIRQRLSISEN